MSFPAEFSHVAAQCSQKRFGHEGAVIWLTGLSASGKSTLATALHESLFALGYACYVLDGDKLRHGLNADLGFCASARRENVRRVGEVAALFADAGLICIVALISPFSADRAKARQVAMQRGLGFHEIHIASDLATCEGRDPKGLYRRARSGQLTDFTGIDSPYESPLAAQLQLQTGQEDVATSLASLLDYVQRQCPLL
jgi:adenylylsulfate kinase